MAQNSIDTLIEKERSALYACAKGKCFQCPFKNEVKDYCMIKLLKVFNNIIEKLGRGK